MQIQNDWLALKVILKANSKTPFFVFKSDVIKCPHMLQTCFSPHFQAKEYFLMDGYVTDHIEILQDHSALYRSLIFFEEEAEARCKMHKRRIDMLEPICNGTGPK